MTPERFETLAEAYGGAIARWPEAERDAASRLMIDRPDWAATTLARANELDDILDSWAPVALGQALREAILAQAPPLRRGLWPRWLVGAGLGAGLATACAAGLLVGIAMAPDLTTDPTADPSGVVTLMTSDEDVAALAGAA
jgi:hypothetical protein